MGYDGRTGHRLAAWLCAATLLAGCGGSPAVRHYLIAPVAGAAPATTLPAGSVLGVGPVSLPEYLARPQMAVRAGDNRIEYLDTERWAEPFADNVRRVLKENLAAVLPGTALRTYPWPRSESVEWQVRIEITRFDAEAGGTVVLEGSWSLQDGHGAELLPARPIAVTVRATDPSPAAIAAAHGAALGQLAGHITADLALHAAAR